jgi:hypothetical protein
MIGNGGFGYDPLFFYPPYGKTFGEVSAEMKHKVSHRAKALEKAKEILKGLEAGGRMEPTSAKGGQRELFEDHPALVALRALHPEGMTPLAALEALDRIKRKFEL